jgi:hypothetical protein
MEAEIWKYEHLKGKPVMYKAYTEDREHMRKLRAIKDVDRHCTYHNIYNRSYYAEDYVFPSSKYDAVAKVLGLPPRRRNANRVAKGKKRAEQNKEHRFRCSDETRSRT